MSNERRAILESVLVVALGAAVGWFFYSLTVDVFPEPWAVVLWWFTAGVPGALWVVIRSPGNMLDSPVVYHFGMGAVVGIAAWATIALAIFVAITVTTIVAPHQLDMPTYGGITPTDKPSPADILFIMVLLVVWFFGSLLPAATVGILAAAFGYIGWKWQELRER